MRKLQVCVLTAFLGFLTGCAGVVSLHPLVLPTDHDAIFDPTLVGAWEDVDPHFRNVYTVSRAESGYNVTLHPSDPGDAGKREVKLSMHLLKVGDRRVLDVYTKDLTCSSETATYSVNCDNYYTQVQVHVFFKLRVEKDSAWWSEMGSDWLKEQIKTRAQLRHEVLTEEHDKFVLTASPDELRRYLLPYVADDRSFEHENEIQRIK
jgi:hypothetical protein